MTCKRTKEYKMSDKKSKPKYKLGMVVAVPLPDGRFAFGKVFKDTDLGVYDFVSKKMESLKAVTAHKIAFFQPVTDEPIKSGEWPILGEEPFPDEESSWGPPKVVGVFPEMEVDPSRLKISHKGTYRQATPKEAAGKDIELFCQRAELCVDIIVDRLINGNNDKYRVKI